MPSGALPTTKAKQQKCTALRSDGAPCGSFALRDSSLCLVHSPDQAETAQAARSNGAATANRRTRANTPDQLAKLNEMVVLGVLSGKIPRSTANAFFKGVVAQMGLHADTSWCGASLRWSRAPGTRTVNDEPQWTRGRLEDESIRSAENFVRSLSDEELKRRIAALCELYDQRGWPRDDRKIATLVYVCHRAAARTAERDPTPENLAAVERWRERQAQIKS